VKIGPVDALLIVKKRKKKLTQAKYIALLANLLNGLNKCSNYLQVCINFPKLAKVYERLQCLPCNNMLMLKQYDNKWAGHRMPSS